MSKEAPPADHTKVDRDVDYYAIIGVSPTATKAQISKAYRLKGIIIIIIKKTEIDVFVFHFEEHSLFCF